MVYLCGCWSLCSRDGYASDGGWRWIGVTSRDSFFLHSSIDGQVERIENAPCAICIVSLSLLKSIVHCNAFRDLKLQVLA